MNFSGMFLLLFLLLTSLSFSANDIPVFISEDGAFLLTTSPSYAGLNLINIDTGKSKNITKGINAGYYATISPENKYVCFKGFKKSQDTLLQAPMLFDIAGNRCIALSSWVPVSGTPSVSLDGKIAFTIGNKLIVKNSDFKVLGKFDLGHHVNLLNFSPDGEKIAFNSPDEQIVVLNITDGKKEVVTDGESAYWSPKFSPAGDKLLARTISGDIVCAELSKGALKSIGKGETPAWVDNDSIAFVKKTIAENEVTQSEVITADSSGLIKGNLILDSGNVEAALSRKNISFTKSGKIKLGILEKSNAVWLKEFEVPEGEGGGISTDPANTRDVTKSGSIVEISGVPYLHQVYDTLDSFCGSWACGASSALMAIQYYNILPPEPRTVSYPYVHTSNYGFYVSEIYTFNSHTYNIGSKDPCNKTKYGGYGYITQNDWEDTRNHMAEYISYHRPTSGVDWSPTYAKAKGEINNFNPFVLLNSLTSAGHYCTVIGYYTTQYTLVFNDPYGNKNLATYPNYEGIRVFYDWPGYNYGNQNLNTVHCYIYCRSSLHGYWLFY